MSSQLVAIILFSVSMVGVCIVLAAWLLERRLQLHRSATQAFEADEHNRIIRVVQTGISEALDRVLLEALRIAKARDEQFETLSNEIADHGDRINRIEEHLKLTPRERTPEEMIFPHGEGE